MFTKNQIEKVDSLFAQYNRPDSPGLCVGVIKDGQLIFTKGYGSANLDYQIPITQHTVFHVASMAKQFTAMAVALLEEQGLVSQGDDIKKFFPELPQYSHTVTVRDLIYMTNGLFDVYGLMNFVGGVRENDYFSRAEAWRAIKACDWLMFEPGTRWSYGNTGYFLLAELVERVSGSSLAEYARVNIFEPLGMTSTFFRDDRTKIIPNRAESYSDYHHVHYNDVGPRVCSRGDRFSINADNMELPGAGQLWSTVLDLAKWDANFYNNKLGLGSPNLIEKVTTRGRYNNGREFNYGYGLYINKTRGLEYVSHPGWANGYSAIIHRIPSQRLSVIALGNYTNLFWDLEVDPGTDCAVDKIIEMVLGQEIYAPPKKEESEPFPAASSADGAAMALAGWYQHENSMIFQLDRKENQLIYRDWYDRELELVSDGDSLSGEEILIKPMDTRLEVTLSGQKGFAFPFAAGDVNFSEYKGTYCCAKLNTAYQVQVAQEGIILTNLNLRDSALDMVYKPSVMDSFYCQAPPYITWYSISFKRDQAGNISAFVFRDDEGSQRENLVFERIE